jgi:hypothetical protein
MPLYKFVHILRNKLLQIASKMELQKSLYTGVYNSVIQTLRDIVPWQPAMIMNPLIAEKTARNTASIGNVVICNERRWFRRV